MKLPTQIAVCHDTPVPEKIDPIVDRMFWKPSGGFWTSTLDDEGGQWLRWLTGEGYTLDSEHWGGRLWSLEPADANVFSVDGPAELRELTRRFPHPEQSEIPPGIRSLQLLIDWPAMATEYDGFWVPNPWPWRFGGDDYEASMFFYSMDAECACWFSWCFEGDPVELDPEPFLSRLKEACA